MPLELLVVENHGETLISLSTHFERCGYVVHTASTTAEAQSVLQSCSVRVALITAGLLDASLQTALQNMGARRPGVVALARGMPVPSSSVVDQVLQPPIDLQSVRSALDAVVAGANVQRPTPTPRSIAIPVDLAPPISDHGPDDFVDDMLAQEEVTLDGPHPILTPHDVTSYLLARARERKTGVLSLELEEGKIDIAMLEGVCVGARDTMRENLLGERLVRAGIITQDDLLASMKEMEASGRRIGEVLLRQGRLDAPTLFDAITDQSQERLTRAVGLRDGWFVFRDDERKARDMAIVRLDLMQSILEWFTRSPDVAYTRQWLEKVRELELHQTDDMEQGLLAYSRVAPRSPLPQHLLMGPRQVGELLEDLEAMGHDAEELAAHVLALELAGLVEVGNEEVELRPRLPVALPASEQVTWDKNAISTLCEEWLRVQGRSHYELLDVDAKADDGDLLTAIAEYKDRFGAHVLPMDRLGPSRAMAEDLHQRIDHATKTLLDPLQRVEYDKNLLPAVQVELRSTVTQTSEALFVAGKTFLDNGELDEACRTFENACNAAPREPDYMAYLGWSRVLQNPSNLKTGVETIKRAHQLNPAAMRPLFFLGMVAVRTEKLDFARQFLQECQRRAPDDPDVRLALQSLEPSE